MNHLIEIELNLTYPINLNVGKLDGILSIVNPDDFIQKISLAFIEAIALEEGEKEQRLGGTSFDHTAIDDYSAIPFQIYFHRKNQKPFFSLPNRSRSTRRFQKIFQSVDLLKSDFFIEVVVGFLGEKDPFVYREGVEVDSF